MIISLNRRLLYHYQVLGENPGKALKYPPKDAEEFASKYLEVGAQEPWRDGCAGAGEQGLRPMAPTRYFCQHKPPAPHACAI